MPGAEPPAWLQQGQPWARTLTRGKAPRSAPQTSPLTSQSPSPLDWHVEASRTK